MAHGRRLILGLILLLGGACAGSGGEDGPPPEPQTTSLEGAIRTVDSVFIEGGRICVAEHEEIPCAITDVDGEFRLDGLPVDEDFTVTYEAEGFMPYRVMTGGRASIPRLTSRVQTPSGHAFDILRAGYVPEEGTGNIAVISRATPPDELFRGQPGTAIRVIGADLPHVYLAANNSWDLDLRETTAAGVAVYFNVPPGRYLVEFEHPDYDCVPYHAWQGPERNVIEVEVRAGELSFTSQLCATPKGDR